MRRSGGLVLTTSLLSRCCIRPGQQTGSPIKDAGICLQRGLRRRRVVVVRKVRRRLVSVVLDVVPTKQVCCPVSVQQRARLCGAVTTASSRLTTLNRISQRALSRSIGG